jgi:hypothetical protein
LTKEDVVAARDGGAIERLPALTALATLGERPMEVELAESEFPPPVVRLACTSFASEE